MGRILAVRLDSDGDVLLCGPALTLLAETGDEVDLLVSSQGLAAAGLLPSVSEVLVHDAPWSGFRPPPVDRAATAELVERIASGGYDRAVVFTSFHQSPLPMALLLRLAGVPFIAAASVDYPGSLLDVRVRREDPPGGGHEVEAAVEIAVAAGARRPARVPGLAVRHPLPEVSGLLPGDGRDLVVVHPGASVPARSLTPTHAGRIVAALRDAGYLVAVTGGPGERDLVARTLAACPGGTGGDGSRDGPGGDGSRDGPGADGSRRAGGGVLDLSGRTDLAQLAAVLERAAVVVVGNTGPAHLAAAVGTPVVSLFSPVVPASRWAPWGVPVRLLGDQHAPCRDTRARECPVDGHPCLTGVPPDEVVSAVTALATERRTRCAS